MQGLYDNTKKSKLTNSTKEKYPKRMFFEEQEYIPKQQLISFLEDKINNLLKLRNNSNYRNQVKELICAYQEVLDFAHKGAKE